MARFVTSSGTVRLLIEVRGEDERLAVMKQW